MRLDLFLKSSRLIPRRSLAQEFCDSGLISLNGAKAKSAKEIKCGDVIEIRRRDRKTVVEVLAVPTNKQVSKTIAHELFRVIRDETTADTVI